MSDVPLGTFLSGGIDSSIITGVMSQLSDDPVKTFTVGFEDDRYDESDIARSVAEYHDTDHTEYVVTSDDVREVIPSVLGQLGEPFADPSLIPTYVVARETSQDVKVALSGDGADELFAGYNRYRGEYYSQMYRSLPKPVRSMIIEPVVNRLPASRNSRLGEVFRKGKIFVGAGSDDVYQRHFQWEQLYEGTVQVDKVWDAYKENLDIVLPHVERLVDTFDEYTVVTSDHGNALGERTWPIPTKIYGHPLGIRMPELTNVPWLVTNKDVRKEVVAGESSQAVTDNQNEVIQRLEDLGYK